MKVYTRRGDGGETDLFGGERVAKDHQRVSTCGDVDELNACLGVAASATAQDDLRLLVREIQGSLFDLGGTLATPDAGHREKKQVPGVSAQDVAELEARIDAFDAELEPLQRFILPGGTPAAATLHRYDHRLARSLAGLGNVLDPDVIVLGGGLSAMGHLYQTIPALWTPYVFTEHVTPPILPPTHGASSGVRGAAWLWDGE